MLIIQITCAASSNGLNILWGDVGLKLDAVAAIHFAGFDLFAFVTARKGVVHVPNAAEFDDAPLEGA
jgi:hypothetical protein